MMVAEETFITGLVEEDTQFDQAVVIIKWICFTLNFI